MNTKTKIAIVAGIVIIIGVLLFWIQKQSDELAELRAHNSALVDQKTLKDGTVRNQRSISSKEDLERLIKESGIDWKLVRSDQKELGSKLKGIQRVVVRSQGWSRTNLDSTSTHVGKNEDGTDVSLSTVQCSDGSVIDCPDTFGYLTKRQELTLQEPFGDKQVPVGTVGFSAWKPSPWDATIHPRQYSVTNVVSVDKEGRSNYHTQVKVSSNGEEVVVPVDSAQYVEKYPEASFMFNPRLYFGVDGGVMASRISGTPVDSVGEVTPNMHVALFSHGKTKLDMNWTFLGIGVGYETQNQSVGFLISPVNYNIGKPLPLVENVFLGPTISLDVKGQVSVLLGIRVGL